MTSHIRAIPFPVLATLLLSVSSLALASPVPPQNVTARSDGLLRTRRHLAQPDKDGWMDFDSVGLMLPLEQRAEPFDYEDKGGSCTSVDCQQHSTYATDQDLAESSSRLHTGSYEATPQGSRDLMRRKAIVIMDKETGEPSYTFPGDDEDSASNEDGSTDEDDEDGDVQSDDSGEEATSPAAHEQEEATGYPEKGWN